MHTLSVAIVLSAWTWRAEKPPPGHGGYSPDRLASGISWLKAMVAFARSASPSTRPPAHSAARLPEIVLLTISASTSGCGIQIEPPLRFATLRAIVLFAIDTGPSAYSPPPSRAAVLSLTVDVSSVAPLVA